MVSALQDGSPHPQPRIPQRLPFRAIRKSFGVVVRGRKKSSEKTSKNCYGTVAFPRKLRPESRKPGGRASGAQKRAETGRKMFLLSRQTCWIKKCMKWVPVRALKLPTISICIVFQGEAIGDDGKPPKPLFWGQNGPKNCHVWGLALRSLVSWFENPEGPPQHAHHLFDQP